MVLLKTLANLWYSEEILERLGISASFAKLVWMSEEWRQGSKLLELGSFDMHKNTTALMIAILGCLEVDMEILDIGMERYRYGNYGIQ